MTQRKHAVDKPQMFALGKTYSDNWPYLSALIVSDIIVEKNRKETIPNLFQVDLIKNRYHLFDLSKAKAKNYYPKQLLELMPKLSSFNKNFEVVVGNIYSTRERKYGEIWGQVYI